MTRDYLSDMADTLYNMRKCIKFFLLKTSTDIYPTLLTFIFVNEFRGSQKHIEAEYEFPSHSYRITFDPLHSQDTKFLNYSQ
jgi:hypothetical protein